ncbi:MAG: LysM peptidoglycan-binding domain-containing protein [Flavisolibacter sp.]|nr:LysM peptidoglycan-binding domain-containing protein [Flavisolibacter sp.]
MKKILFCLFIFFCSLAAIGQNGLIVQSNNKGLYINHTVQPKENFYSIGRLYAISPKDIAAFNNLDMNNGLQIGQTLMIPLNTTNFSQTSGKGIPVYYVVGEKEGLYRVSLKNNNVLMANLRKWNHLTSDNLSTGQRLIVGYISATDLPDNTANNSIAATTAPAKTEPAPKEPVKEQIGETAPEKPIVVKKEPPVENKPVRNTATSVAYNDANGGYFKGQFEQQSRALSANKEMTVTSSIFKTASGWQDGKYYALMDDVEPGTIIKIANPNNNRAIYAKVLGQMGGIRQNAGLDLRISNAAASALNINDTDKFVVRVNY